MAASPSSPLRRWLRRAAIAAAALLALIAVLFVSVSPAVDSNARPTARDVQAARDIWQQLKTSQGTGTATRVRLDDGMTRGLAALASDATEVASFDARITQGVLYGQASIALPAGLWINASAAATGEHSGFPALRVKVGRVTFPLVAGRWFAEAIRSVLRFRGVGVPPLDEIVRHLRVDPQDVFAELMLPGEGSMMHGMIAASGKALNHALVSELYCRLTAAQHAEPATDLSQVVRRAFGQVSAEDSEEYSRAAFVALSFFVVGDRAEPLVPEAASLTQSCPRPRARIHLHGRRDLAKHWALSAALAAVLGEQAATSLGEWKELNDSLSGGSGFSFVDIAADRAGLQTALRAVDPQTAESTLKMLGRASEEDLLPAAILRAPEALSEASFEDRFGGLDQENYRRAIASIDEKLAQSRSSDAVGN